MNIPTACILLTSLILNVTLLVSNYQARVRLNQDVMQFNRDIEATTTCTNTLDLCVSALKAAGVNKVYPHE